MGFKKTSELIAVSFGIEESAANTFTQDEIALQLDVLNNEIFVVLACDLNLSPPDSVAGLNTSTAGSLTSTTQAAVASLDATNCIVTSRDFIQMDAGATTGSAFSRSAMESYTGDLDYIALIATNNFFIQIEGVGNAVAKFLTGRVWGFRARADSSTYAALVQSEVLSA
jgi:hypothetical protein